MDVRKQLLDFINHPCNSMNTCQPCTDCKAEKKEVVALMDQGHTYHCACRILWGDGECECDKAGKVPGNASRMVLAAHMKGD